MGIGRGFRSVISVALLFVIAILCVIFFYTCSIRPTKVEGPVEEPPKVEEVKTSPTIQEPEPEPEPVVETPDPAGPEEPVEPEAVQTETAEPEETPADVPEEMPADPVPEQPDLDWFVYTELYEDTPAEDWDSALFEDSIDWSQFVFSDEEIALPDGTYYAQLYVNDTALGSIKFEQVNTVPHFSRADLRSELYGTLSDSFYEQFFADEHESYSMEYLESLAERVVYNSNDLVLKLYFNSAQVPVQTLSMTGSSYSLLRQNYDVVGNVVVEPASFSFMSNISGYLNAQYSNDRPLNLTGSLSLSNTFSFWNTTFVLPISLNYSRFYGVTPTIGSWYGYIDFPKDSIRLSFGNVGNSGFSRGTPFGFTIEKSYSFGTGSAMGNQYAQTITLVEDSMVDIKVNGNSVYSKTLSLGVYRLTDFALVQGSNDVEVMIHPVSMGSGTSRDEVHHFDQSYDTSLMAKGESVWRFGASIPKISQPWNSSPVHPFGFVTPDLPSFPGSGGYTAMQSVYDFSAMSVFWDQSIGLSHAYTQTHSFSFVFERDPDTGDNPGGYSAVFGGTVSGILATPMGTTRASLNGVISSANPSRNSLSLNCSQGFANPRLKPLSLSMSYALNCEAQTLSLSTGYSFSISKLRMSVSGSTAYKFKTTKDSPSIDDAWTWTASASLNTNLGKSLSFSLSASINQSLNYFATASLSMSMGRHGTNASATTNNGQNLIGNLGWYYRPGSMSRNSFQLNLSNINLLGDPWKDHTLSGSWSRSGEIVNMSIRQQASSNYTRFNTTFAFNTALAFADGQLAMTNSLYGPFLIVSPKGGLRDSRISVSSAANSSRKTFGNVIYTRLGMYRNNNVVVYASNGSLFTSSGSFLFKVTPVARQGFLATISLDASIAVSGVLRRSGNSVYDTYSSPIYKVSIAENGKDVKSLEIDDKSYFFTDIDGRYILSDLASGIYMIDLNINGKWYACFFEVPSVDVSGKVALLADFYASDIDPADVTMHKYDVMGFDESYAGSIYLPFDRLISESEYWDMLFSLQDDPELDDDMWSWDAEGEDVSEAGSEEGPSEDATSFQQVTNTAL